LREWKLFHPERFQGAKKKYHYFEGWYFKIAVQQPTKQVLSLIHIGENTFRWEKVHIRLTDEGLDLQADFSSWAGMPMCRGWSVFVSQSPPVDAGKLLFNARCVRHAQHHTRSRFSILHVSDSRVEVVVATKEHRITLIGTLGGASGLAAPKQGDVKRTIYESIDGMLHLRVETIQENLLIEGDSSHAGLVFSEASKLMDGGQKV